MKIQSACARDLSVASAVCRRDLLRFRKESSRWLGVVAQPLLFWFVIGSGLGASVRMVGDPEGGFVRYFFPGSMLLTVVFTCVFASISVIEDKRAGFLRGVLVAPGSRAALVAGKLLGVACLASAQCILFALAAPLAGFSLGGIHWPGFAGGLLLSVVAMAGVNFAVAWRMDSTQGYHAVMSLLLLPLWIVSGAMFPRATGPLAFLLHWNPLAPMLHALRASLEGSSIPAGTWLVLCTLALAGVAAALAAASPSRSGVLNAAD